MDLNAVEQQIRCLEFKVSSTEQTIDSLQRQLDEFEAQAHIATSEIVEKERILNEQTREMERMRAGWQEKFASEKDRLKRIMERRLAEKQAELERKMCLTDEKFRLLREILNNNDDDWKYFGDINIPAPSALSTTSSESSAPVTRIKKLSATEMGEVETPFAKTRSATDAEVQEGLIGMSLAAERRSASRAAHDEALEAEHIPEVSKELSSLILTEREAVEIPPPDPSVLLDDPTKLEWNEPLPSTRHLSLDVGEQSIFGESLGGTPSPINEGILTYRPPEDCKDHYTELSRFFTFLQENGIIGQWTTDGSVYNIHKLQPGKVVRQYGAVDVRDSRPHTPARPESVSSMTSSTTDIPQPSTSKESQY